MNTSQNCCCQYHYPHGELTHASPGDPPTLTSRPGSVFYRINTPFLWVFVCAWFYVYPPKRLHSLFTPCPVEVLQLNLAGLQSQIPWGFLVLLWDPQAGKPDVELRTFTRVRELLWYYFSQFVGRLHTGYGIRFLSWLHPPAISLWLLLYLQP